jgi:hypothetical protein
MNCRWTVRGSTVKLGHVILVLVCAGSLLASAQDAAGSRVRAKILTLEAVWIQAEEHGDAKDMQTLLDPTMVDISEGGTLRDKSQVIADASAAPAHATRIVSESVEANVYGDTAVATGVYREMGVVGGKPYQHRSRFIATWVYRNGAWVCVNRQSTLIR